MTEAVDELGLVADAAHGVVLRGRRGLPHGRLVLSGPRLNLFSQLLHRLPVRLKFILKTSVLTLMSVIVQNYNKLVISYIVSNVVIIIIIIIIIIIVIIIIVIIIIIIIIAVIIIIVVVVVIVIIIIFS